MNARRPPRLAAARPLTLAIAALFPLHAAVAADRDETVLGRIEVVATIPLPGLDQPRERVPANVHSVDAGAPRAGWIGLRYRWGA